VTRRLEKRRRGKNPAQIIVSEGGLRNVAGGRPVQGEPVTPELSSPGAAKRDKNPTGGDLLRKDSRNTQKTDLAVKDAQKSYPLGKEVRSDRNAGASRQGTKSVAVKVVVGKPTVVVFQ